MSNDAPVIVVGAGLAGLACAQRLSRAGVEVVVLEASDGGRRPGPDRRRRRLPLRPRLPAAQPGLPGPEARPRDVGSAALDLRPFRAGVVVAHGRRRSVLADPRREPTLLVASLRAPLGTFAEKVRFAAWAASTLLPVRRQLARPGPVADRGARRVRRHRSAAGRRRRPVPDRGAGRGRRLELGPPRPAARPVLRPRLARGARRSGWAGCPSWSRPRCRPGTVRLGVRVHGVTGLVRPDRRRRAGRPGGRRRDRPDDGRAR